MRKLVSRAEVALLITAVLAILALTIAQAPEAEAEADGPALFHVMSDDIPADAPFQHFDGPDLFCTPAAHVGITTAVWACEPAVHGDFGWSAIQTSSTTSEDASG